MPMLPATADEAMDGTTLGRIAAEDILLRSKAGKTLVPPAEVVTALAGDEDAARWAMPEDTALIEAIYTRALGGESWDTVHFDDSISPAGQAAAILAGLRLVGLLEEVGVRESARARLYALGAEAQADYALVNMVTPDPDTLNAAEKWLLLHAISELAHATSPAGPAVSQDELFHAWFAEGAHQLQQMAAAASPSNYAEFSMAARALSAYSLVARDPDEAARQIEVLVETAPDPIDAVDTARAVRMLVAATRATGNGDYAARARTLLDDLMADFDSTTSALDGVETLSIWELADVLGALGDAHAAGLGDTRAEIGEMIHHLVLDSGLMAAAPTSNNAFYPHLEASEPIPSDDRIWTFASAIGYDPASGWSVTDRAIDLPGALYAAAEMMSLPAPEPAVASAPEPEGGLTVTVETTEFAFSPDTIELTEGEEVTLRLVNNGVIEHNIDIPSLGILVTAGPGETAETTFVVPGPDQSGDFFCSLPGHKESGMVGTMSIDVAPMEPAGSDGPEALALPELDEAGGSPTVVTAIVIALGFFLGMMVLVVGMLQFMKGFEDPR
ncbi:MAG: plastocyanin/azurin family copper-binding protein [Acidimicrobiia bacterium]